MALSDVLNNLTSARDALVTAINGKGGTVATTATIRQCAEAVTAMPEGGGEVWEAPAGAVLYLPLSAPFGLNPTNTVNFGEVSGILCASFSGNACFNLQTKPLSGTGDFSISIWEKFDELNANELSQAYFFGNATASRSVGFHWVKNTGQFSLNIFSSDETKNINVKIETTGWHHIAAVYSNGTLKLFVDNALKGSSTVSLAIGSNTSTVGGLGGDSERNWAGELAGLRVYDRALTEAEISTLYEEFRRATGSGGDVSVDPVGELFFTTTEADGKVEGGYMFAGTGTLKLQLATGEITELSLTDTMQRAFSAYELSSVRVVSGAESVTLLSINRIGIDYIDLSNFWSLEHLHMPISSSPEIKNLSSCHRLNYVDVGDSALSSAQVDKILADILASNSHLNYESFSGSIDVSQNAVPTAAGLETIAQLESVGWSVNYDRE